MPDADASECTFWPKITPVGQKMGRRSLSELSAGDQRRREAKMARLREQFRQNEMKGLSSKPKVNTKYNKNAGVNSRLRVLEDPDGYLLRQEENRKKKSARCEEELKGRIEEERKQCTFKPEVMGQCPVFVKRMAESYRIVKDLKEKENQAQENSESKLRPEWR